LAHLHGERGRLAGRATAHDGSELGNKSRRATRNGKGEAQPRKNTGAVRSSSALKANIAGRRRGVVSKSSVATTNDRGKNSADETKKPARIVKKSAGAQVVGSCRIDKPG
jgi:hypothetical protein